METTDAPPPSPPPKTAIERLHDWGSSSLPPSLLATLVTALHARPLQPLPLVLFTPPLLFASYLNLAGYPTGSAGLAAAWSGIYALLALRRRQSLRGKFSIRGLVRGAAVGLGTANAVAGGWVYFMGNFERDEEERLRRKRWTTKD
ncbi:hypothetical protein RJ55_06688 [Drechmeria coniospora]|nr:hypothetical protein RJ55_06688 [Drechmeria coniospora]